MGTFFTTKTAVISGLSITLLGALYIYSSTTTLSYTMPHSTNSSPPKSNIVPGLTFTLSEEARSPPSLLVKASNKSPDTPYTLLKWGTPLDDAALNTGVFIITDAETGEKVEQVELKINRKMPPADEELITLAPGTEEVLSVVFDKPWMPAKKPAKYKVKAKGTFQGLWGKYGGDVSEAEMAAYNQSPYSGKTFETNEVVMRVH